IGAAATEILSTNITASLPAVGPSQPVTFTARVTTVQSPANSAVVDAGSVTFFDVTTGTALGTAPVNSSGIATLSNVTFSLMGTHTIRVQYLGSSPRFAASGFTNFSQIVLKASTINASAITTGN